MHNFMMIDRYRPDLLGQVVDRNALVLTGFYIKNAAVGYYGFLQLLLLSKKEMVQKKILVWNILI